MEFINKKEIRYKDQPIEKIQVVFNQNDGKSVEYAASEIKKYLKLASNIEITENNESDSLKIFVGPSENKSYMENFGEEDYKWIIKNREIHIFGGRTRGTIYGVYAFLEDIIGWRFLTTDTEILKDGDINIEDGEYFWHPQLEWRDVCFPVYWKADIACKRRLNSSYARNLEEKHGGSFLYPGRFVHTMESLLGVPQHQQPCFSDEDNLKKCIENVKKLLNENPDARIISITQNDCDADEKTYCTCEKCAKIDEEEGSHAGSLLRFVNSIGEAIENDYPDVKLITLAYVHTIKCPKITRPRKNVIIEFAPMTMCYAHTVDCECNKETVKDFEDWSKITSQIYLWDYLVDFSFTVPVFPNYNLLRKNVRYYVDHNVTGMFCEGDSYANDGECTDLCELKSYLLSKLLCNPMMSEEEFLEHRKDFLLGYYGKNGEEIGRFIDIICKVANAPGHYIGCFNNPTTLYPIPDFIDKIPDMEKCWDNAEKGAETDLQKSHCERSRLSYTYLKLLYTFDKEVNSDKKEAIIVENEKFYRLLQKYNIHPRGISSELLNVDNFNLNAAVEIYWPSEKES